MIKKYLYQLDAINSKGKPICLVLTTETELNDNREYLEQHGYRNIITNVIDITNKI